MKKILFVPTLLVAACMMSIGCSDKAKEAQRIADSIRIADSVRIADSIAHADSIAKAKQDSIRMEEQKAALEAEAIEFITNWYNRKQYESTAMLKKHCSQALLGKLRRAYEYEDGGYASWLFRTDYQDGPNNAHRITKVLPLGDDMYKYHFLDMGNQGSHTVKLVKVNDVWQFQSLK